MPNALTQVPSYRRHVSGQARVTLNGQDIYLGTYGSDASHAEYNRVTAEWLVNNRRLPTPGKQITVAELILAYWEHCKTYYRKNGSPTSELAVIRSALKPLRRLYGHTLVIAFRPSSLEAVCFEMIRLGWVRKSINKQRLRIVRMFRWGVAKEMVPVTLVQELATVQSLTRERCQAKESAPVRPVDIERVNAVLPLVSSQVRSMIELQLVTGMRPGEVCQMRTRDISFSGAKIGEQVLWEYRPATHKTIHHEHERIIYLGSRAQAILASWLKPNDPDAYLFSPTEAENARRAKLREQRKTPDGYGNSPGTNRVRKPKRFAGNFYTVTAYRRAIARACEAVFAMPDEIKRDKADKADVAKAKALQRQEWRAANVWHPHQLRHNAATRFRKEFGLEAAQVILGHKTLSVTELYAEKNIQAAQELTAKAG